MALNNEESKVDKEKDSPSEVNVSLSPIGVSIDLFRYAVIPLGVAIYFAREVVDKGVKNFEIDRWDIILVLISIMSLSMLYFFVVHIFLIARNKNNYLIINSNGIYSPYKSLAINWKNIEGVKVSKLASRTFLGSDSISVWFSKSDSNHEKSGQGDVLFCRWRLDGTNVNRLSLFFFAKQCVRDGKKVILT